MTRGASRAARFLGLGREINALPAIAGSFVIVLVLAGGVGRWAPAVVIGWAAVGLGLLTPAGERLAVRTLGWCQPRGYCLIRDGVERVVTVGSRRLHAVDCYLVPHTEANAFATGRRSVAVTARLLDAVAAGRVDQGAFEAVLAHEIGHLVSGATRYRLASCWWSAPWRHTGQRVVAMCLRPHRSRSRVRTIARAMIALIAVAVSAGHLMRAGQVTAAAVLVVGTVAAVLLPRIGLAVSRRCETVADDYAARQGRSDDLARAITLLTPPTAPTGGWWGAGHPEPVRRVRRLDRTAGAGVATEPLGTSRAPQSGHGRDRTPSARLSAPTP